MDEGLLTRSGAAARAIARDLLGRAPGDRIPSVTRYATDTGVGVITIQRALAYLREAGAVTLDARARSGTYLASADRARLWSLGYGEPLVAYMPLPYSRRYEGLATGIDEALERAGIPHRAAFMSGAMPRLHAAASTHGFAVVSALALEIASDTTMHAAVLLPEQSYVAAHGVIRRRNLSGPIRSVGIDEDSIDQAVLTRAEFGTSVDYSPIHYLQLVPSVRRGLIDAAVWSLDSVASDDELELQPLATPDAIELDTRATRAVFAVSADNSGVARLLSDCLAAEDVLLTQREVMAGDRLPSY